MHAICSDIPPNWARTTGQLATDHGQASQFKAEKPRTSSGRPSFSYAVGALLFWCHGSPNSLSTKIPPDHECFTGPWSDVILRRPTTLLLGPTPIAPMCDRIEKPMAPPCGFRNLLGAATSQFQSREPRASSSTLPLRRTHQSGSVRRTTHWHTKAQRTSTVDEDH